ncbi:Cyclin-dependent kinase 4 inhibitor D [Labeo rohita]|uniref:Cyclin-dependent kinase 4 inhibitor D n=2 Tax=Labeo rohita TaxID=84645 RepID=A0ABQ8MG26_LABRO|nr:Cyclin-dependent kinase 4 inhibitor D [Labeo rohita]
MSNNSGRLSDKVSCLPTSSFSAHKAVEQDNSMPATYSVREESLRLNVQVVRRLEMTTSANAMNASQLSSPLHLHICLNVRSYLDRDHRRAACHSWTRGGTSRIEHIKEDVSFHYLPFPLHNSCLCIDSIRDGMASLFSPLVPMASDTMAEDTAIDRLSTAAAIGDLNEIEQTLQSNVNVNEKNKYGRTPLQVMKLGCPRIAEMLLQAGADPNERDPILQLTVSHDAARDGYLDTLQVLAQNGADVNLPDNDGNLPLHLAAREGHLDVVQFLVSNCNTPPFLQNANGYTPRDLALMHRKHKTVEWLDNIAPL